MADNDDANRRTIDELKMRYVLEPDLRDLYVEGPQDKGLLEWYLNQLGHSDITVIEINHVAIERELLNHHGLPGGNKNRLIALALELDKSFGNTIPTVRCVVDADFDFILSPTSSAYHLLRTDYTSLDLYSFNETSLTKVIAVGLNIQGQNSELILCNLSPVLKDLFIIRAANTVLGWSMRWIRFTRHCRLGGDEIHFDRAQFVTNYLVNNGKGGRRDEFESECNRLTSAVPQDDRQCIRGDDFVELLGWYLHERFHWSGYQSGRRSTLPFLRTALETEQLSTERLFSTLDSMFRRHQL